MLIEEISRLDETCKFQFSRMRRSLKEEDVKLYKYINGYLESYCRFNDLSIDDVLKIKDKFAQRYINDLKAFEQTGSYPYQIPFDNFELSRTEYDVVLILSFLLEKHRFKIARWLVNQKFEGELLAVGIGPGVEFGIIKEFCGNEVSLTGYDMELSDYVLNRYTGEVKKQFFSPGSECFSMVLLVEILEHLENPLELLRNTISVLDNNGSMLLTTAVDMPQFDHLYNFSAGQIVDMLGNEGMAVENIETVHHQLNIGHIASSNELILAKKVVVK